MGEVSTWKGDEPKNPELRDVPVDRLRALMKTISGDPSLVVTTELTPEDIMSLASQGVPPELAWFCRTDRDPRTGKETRVIRVPETTTEPEVSILGKASHEAGHAAITRMGSFVPDEVAQEIGFTSLLRSVEERATDQVVRDRYEGAGDWVDGARRIDQEAGKARVKGKEAETMAQIPKFAQLSSLIVYGPHMDDFSIFDPEVVEAYRQIESAVQEIERTIPQEGAKETEVIEEAKKRYAKTYKEIWPVIQSLVERDMQERQAEEALKEMTGEDRAESKETGLDVEKMLDLLPDELKEELEKILDKMQSQEGQKTSQEESDTNEEASSTQGGGEEQGSQEPKSDQPDGSEGEQASDPQTQSQAQKSESEAQQSSSQAESSQESTAQQSETKGQQNPSEMSPELAKALSDALGKVSPEKAQEIKDKAEKQLKSAEDELNESMSSIMQDDDLKTHQEYESIEQDEPAEDANSEDDESQPKDKSEQEKIEDEMAREIASLAGFETRRSEYDQLYQEVRGLDEELYQELEEFFNPTTKDRTRLKSAGSRINLKAVFKRDAAIAAGGKNVEAKIFEVTEKPEKKDYVFSIVVDLSDSMNESNKLQETYKALILISEVLNRLGIKFEIIGFSDDAFVILDMDDDLDVDGRKKIGQSMYTISGTETNKGIRMARKSLGGVSAKEKYMVVLTDGQPNGYAVQATHEEIAAAAEDDIRVIGLGLGYGTGMVQDFFPVSMPNVSASELPETLRELFEEIILNPNQFLTGQN